MNTIILVCKEVFFYSDLDEAVFFEWIKKIESIQNCKGVLDEFHLEVSLGVDDDDLREIIALFARYNIVMSQLRQLVRDDNKAWFKNKQAYWYLNIFE